MNDVMIPDFAQAFFASSFWDEWENMKDSEDMVITESERLAIRKKYCDRQEVTETIDPLFAYYGLKLDEYLPTEFVKEIVEAINKHWTLPSGDAYSVEQLYKQYPYAAWAAVAQQTGMGISPTDDTEVQSLFGILGITELSGYQEAPSAWDGVAALQQAITQKRTKIYFDEELGSRLCQWHNGMDAIYAVGSSATAGLPVSPEIVQNAVAVLDKNLLEVRQNNPDTESVEELMELIEELLEPFASLPVE